MQLSNALTALMKTQAMQYVKAQVIERTVFAALNYPRTSSCQTQPVALLHTRPVVLLPHKVSNSIFSLSSQRLTVPSRRRGC